MPTDFLHGVETVAVDRGPRPIQTIRSAVIGLIGTAPAALETAFPLDTPVLVKSRGDMKDIGATGTLPKALSGIFDNFGAFVVVIRVAEGAGADEQAKLEATLPNIVGEVTAGTGAMTGAHAFRAAEAEVGLSPMILIAPGFTSIRPIVEAVPTANPVLAGLVTHADRMRAHIVALGPNTTDAAALTYAGEHSSRRIFLVDPGVNSGEDPAARIAGLIAKTDHTEGFWQSPSNHVISGVVSLDRPIDYALGDPNTRANLLNEAKIATIIRDDGFRLWGNRTLSADPKWAFLSRSRTADMIDLSIMQGHRWAVDRAITKGYFDDVTASVNAYLRKLQTRGAILGGKCWADPDFNQPTDLAAGGATFSYDFTAPPPAERVTFRSHAVDDYLTNIFTV